MNEAERGREKERARRKNLMCEQMCLDWKVGKKAFSILRDNVNTHTENSQGYLPKTEY